MDVIIDHALLQRVLNQVPSYTPMPEVMYIPQIIACIRHERPIPIGRFDEPKLGGYRVTCPRCGGEVVVHCRYTGWIFHSATREYEVPGDISCDVEEGAGALLKIEELVMEHGYTPEELLKLGIISEKEAKEIREYLAKVRDAEEKLMELERVFDTLFEWHVADATILDTEVSEAVFVVNVPGIGPISVYYSTYNENYITDPPDEILKDETLYDFILTAVSHKMWRLNKNKDLIKRLNLMEKELPREPELPPEYYEYEKKKNELLHNIHKLFDEIHEMKDGKMAEREGYLVAHTEKGIGRVIGRVVSRVEGTASAEKKNYIVLFPQDSQPEPDKIVVLIDWVERTSRRGKQYIKAFKWDYPEHFYARRIKEAEKKMNELNARYSELFSKAYNIEQEAIRKHKAPILKTIEKYIKTL